MDKKTTWIIVAVVVLILIILLVIRATTTPNEAPESIVVGDEALVLSPITEDEEFVVDHVELTSPGYIVVWASGESRTDEDIIGTSALLPAGSHNNVAITRRPNRRYVSGSSRVTVTVHYDDGDDVIEPTEEPVAVTEDGTELSADVPVEETVDEESEATPEEDTDATSTDTENTTENTTQETTANQTNTTTEGDTSMDTTETEVVSDTTAFPEPRTILVHYTDTGFEPAVVTIKPGDAVEFINKSQASMWVASAVHPTHEELPEFDQEEAVGFNGVYDFTFEEDGSWNYHNHANSEHTGTVVVENQ